MSTNTNLKRKNEELDPEDQLNKRVALDSEQVGAVERQQEGDQTAPPVNGEREEVPTYDTEEPEDEANGAAEIAESAEPTEPEPEEPKEPTPTSASAEPRDDAALDAERVLENISAAAAATAAAPAAPAAPAVPAADAYAPYEPAYEPSVYDSEDGSKPISNHREKESDPTYVMFRMYCPVKEASAVVGKRGEKINHIRDKANVRINVSDNLKNIPERIILVRGPAENVARAFGLIARTILEEPEDEPASMMSKSYELKVLVPHPMVGYIIGKQGSKFREIEECLAAKLKAAEQPLPFSTDRILLVTGVGDAIHIAMYYIAQVTIEHKDCLKKNKVVFYNPANYNQALGGNVAGVGLPPQHQHPQHPQPPQPQYPQMAPLLQQYPAAMPPMGGPMHMPYMPYQQQPPQGKQPYNFQMMFQPAVQPQQYGSPVPNPATQVGGAMGAAPPPYTDEHGNTIVGDVITSAPVPVGSNPDKYNQDIFVANENIGLVIGKGGNNIKQIRLNSGCLYVKIEPDQRQLLMLGGGRGLTSIRKLTLTGSLQAINTAIYLINQRIAIDKERNSH